MSDFVELKYNDQIFKLPVVIGSEGEKAIDISSLRQKTGFITLDVGYANTGSCTSSITFMDGEKGILRYRGIPVEELAERLTLAGLEVASIERIGDWWDRERIVVGEVREVLDHPNADRLVLVDVAYGGGEVERCVTGAPNLFDYKGAGPVSLKVAFAMEGAELYDGYKEGQVKTRLKRTKIRGIPSRAMVCSEKELGISEEHEGILFLPGDAPVGMPLVEYLGDTVLDLDLTPNLARCFSMIGVAREVAALTGLPVRYPSTGWQAWMQISLPGPRPAGCRRRWARRPRPPR